MEAGPPAVRASDAERDRAVASLREHCAAGRLTLEEFAERVDEAYAARTLAELEAVTRELPAPATRRRASRLSISIMGNVAIAVPEGVEVDLGGLAIMGQKAYAPRDSRPRPGAPLVRIRALALMGSVLVASRAGG